MAEVSVQLYSVRDQLAADRDGTLRRLADVGFRNVEPFHPADDPENFRKLIDELNMKVPTAHGWGLLTDRRDEVFAGAATIGAEKLIVASIPEAEFGTAEGVARSATLLNELAGQAATHGLKLGYHNHWWEFESRIGDVSALEAMVEQLDEAVFLELDTYWAQLGGADVKALLGQLGDRVQALHVKDGPLVKQQPNVVVGTGSMDVPGVLAAAPHALRVIEFDQCAGDVVQEIADSFAYVTSIEPPA